MQYSMSMDSSTGIITAIIYLFIYLSIYQNVYPQIYHLTNVLENANYNYSYKVFMIITKIKDIGIEISISYTSLKAQNTNQSLFIKRNFYNSEIPRI